MGYTTPRKIRGYHRGKPYTIKDIAEKTGLPTTTIESRLRKGWTVPEILTYDPSSKMNITQWRKYKKHRIMRCKCCGMGFSYFTRHRPSYCSPSCLIAYRRNPQEFGLWWKE